MSNNPNTTQKHNKHQDDDSYSFICVVCLSIFTMNAIHLFSRLKPVLESLKNLTFARMEESKTLNVLS